MHAAILGRLYSETGNDLKGNYNTESRACPKNISFLIKENAHLRLNKILKIVEQYHQGIQQSNQRKFKHCKGV